MMRRQLPLAAEVVLANEETAVRLQGARDDDDRKQAAAVLANRAAIAKQLASPQCRLRSLSLTCLLGPPPAHASAVWTSEVYAALLGPALTSPAVRAISLLRCPLGPAEWRVLLDGLAARRAAGLPRLVSLRIARCTEPPSPVEGPVEGLDEAAAATAAAAAAAGANPTAFLRELLTLLADPGVAPTHELSLSNMNLAALVGAAPVAELLASTAATQLPFVALDLNNFSLDQLLELDAALAAHAEASPVVVDVIGGTASRLCITAGELTRFRCIDPCRTGRRDAASRPWIGWPQLLAATVCEAARSMVGFAQGGDGAELDGSPEDGGGSGDDGGAAAAAEVPLQLQEPATAEELEALRRRLGVRRLPVSLQQLLLTSNGLPQAVALEIPGLRSAARIQPLREESQELIDAFLQGWGDNDGAPAPDGSRNLSEPAYQTDYPRAIIISEKQDSQELLLIPPAAGAGDGPGAKDDDGDGDHSDDADWEAWDFASWRCGAERYTNLRELLIDNLRSNALVNLLD